MDALEGTLIDELRDIWKYPKEAVSQFTWEARPDGSRGVGKPGMILDEELKRPSGVSP